MASETKSIAIAMLMRDIGSVDFFMRANLHNIHDNAKKNRRKIIKKNHEVKGVKEVKELRRMFCCLKTMSKRLLS